MQSSLTENYSNQTYLFQTLHFVSYQVSTICVQNSSAQYLYIDGLTQTQIACKQLCVDRTPVQVSALQFARSNSWLMPNLFKKKSHSLDQSKEINIQLMKTKANMSPNSSRKKAVYSCLYVVTWNRCTPHIRVKKTLQLQL